MESKQRIILSALIFSVMFFVCGIALGDTATIPNPLTGINCLPQLLQRVTDFIRNLALALMVPFIIWGGIVLMTSSGNPEKVKEGKNIILYTMVGVIVTFLANVAVDVVAQLFQAPGGNGCSYLITMFFA